MMCTRVRDVARRVLATALFLLGATLTAASGPTTPDAYRVGLGDVLSIEVFQHQDLSGDYEVGADGAIRFPLLDRVPVAGSSVAELAARLESLLEADFYVDLQLEVSVKEFKSRPVTVLGEVGRPGTYYLEGPTELATLIAEAGGLKATAGSEIQIQRRAVSEESETQEVMTVDRESLATGATGFLVNAGEVVSVPGKRLYFITGEVVRPDQYEIEKGMTLMRAVSQAGGLGPFASQRVEIRRDGPDGTTIVPVDLSRVRRGKDPDPEIRPGDVIIVERRFF